MLTWTRWRPGYYTSGNFVVERVDGMYGPTWTLTVDGQAVRVTKKSLHECQAVAGSIAYEASLFVTARLES